MTSKEELETMLIKELMQYESDYLQKAEKEKTYKIITETYEQVKNSFANYMKALQGEVDTRTQYGAALKTPKIDPYIAGGLGQGIAGVGGGIYSAVRTAETNANISRARIKLKVEADMATKRVENVKKYLMESVYKLDELLNKIPNILEERKINQENIMKEIQKDKIKKMTGKHYFITCFLLAMIIIVPSAVILPKFLYYIVCIIYMILMGVIISWKQ